MSSRMSAAATALFLVTAGLAACARPAPGPRAPRSEASLRAVAALQAGDFDAAGVSAGEALSHDPGDAHAAVVRAVVGYKVAANHLYHELWGVVFDTVGRADGFDHARVRAALEHTHQLLVAVDADLAVIAQDEAFALPLCLACWAYDLDESGMIDDGERLLFQIEFDAGGAPIPEDDPQRKPRFRFDLGDVYWARAMMSFQLALLDLILAYRWTDIDRLVFGSASKVRQIVIHLDHPARVQSARTAILAGLDHADRARRAYLAETDDEGEWVPNPRQRNHPLPLPVDDALYETWAGVLSDLRRLIDRKEVISVTELAQLGDHVWKRPPRGFVDVGLMLSKPRDIVFDLVELDRLDDDDGDDEQNIEQILASILGEYYVREGTPTGLIRRLTRMRSEVERGEESLERKLRYLFWLN